MTLASVLGVAILTGLVVLLLLILIGALFGD